MAHCFSPWDSDVQVMSPLAPKGSLKQQRTDQTGNKAIYLPAWRWKTEGSSNLLSSFAFPFPKGSTWCARYKYQISLQLLCLSLISNLWQWRIVKTEQVMWVLYVLKVSGCVNEVWFKMRQISSLWFVERGTWIQAVYHCSFAREYSQ